MQHVVIDLETTDTRSTSAILQIGAVLFDRGEDGSVSVISGRDWKLDYQAQLSTKKFTKSKDTMDWWAAQEEALRDEVFSGTLRLAAALEQLGDFIASDGVPNVIWVRGLNFDIPILDHAFEQAKKKKPWQYYRENCSRTLHRVAGNNNKVTPARAHHALYDALADAMTICDSLNLIGK